MAGHCLERAKYITGCTVKDVICLAGITWILYTKHVSFFQILTERSNLTLTGWWSNKAMLCHAYSATCKILVKVLLKYLINFYSAKSVTV